MIARVEAHNRLYGFAFVIGEFALVGLVALVLAALYSARANVLLAATFAGITANSLVIIFLAIRSMTRGEIGIGILRIYTKRAVREQVMREHPDISRDTAFITIAVVAPFLLLILVLIEAVRRPPPTTKK